MIQKSFEILNNTYTNTIDNSKIIYLFNDYFFTNLKFKNFIKNTLLLLPISDLIQHCMIELVFENLVKSQL